MSKQPRSTVTCSVCGREKSKKGVVPGEMVQDLVVDEIRRLHPEWKPSEPVCLSCVNNARGEHIRRLLAEEKGELSALEEEVLSSLRAEESISANINEQFSEQLTLGERLADRIAEFGGSWKFIIAFGVVMVGWIVLNTIW